MLRAIPLLAVFLSALVGALPVAAAERAPVSALQEKVEFLTRPLNAEGGIYMKSRDTGEEIGSAAGPRFDTMSVIKTPIMVEAFRQIDAGKLSLGDRVTIQESDMRFGTGILRSLDPGASVTLKDVLMLMNIVSDN